MKSKDHAQKCADLTALEQGLAQHRQNLDNLKQSRHKQFKDGFDLIAKHVKQIYRLITNGGDADLEPID